MTTETAEVVHVPDEVTVGQVSIYRSTEPDDQLAEARARAKALVEVVEEQGLARSFGGGRPHVQVEGWQFLASQFGLIPDIEWTKELGDGEGWEARAALRRLSDGQVISHADAECRRSEANWKGRDSYAIRSMAETRAVSKVCRIALSSVMVMAGFAATPAEEMDGVRDAVEPPKSTDDPHCPACLAVNGELVAVTGPHDRKPFWRCVNKGEQCAGSREYKGKTYSWSGWDEDFDVSKADWLEQNPQHAGPQTKTVGDRGNYSKWITSEIRQSLNIEEDDAKSLVKPALVYAIKENRFDPELALGEPLLSNELSDDQLRQIIKNLDASEAQIAVTAACELGAGE